jgi:hypothetical protein
VVGDGNASVSCGGEVVLYEGGWVGILGEVGVGGGSGGAIIFIIIILACRDS